MAAVEIRHALFHITGEAHHGGRAVMPVSDPGLTAAPVPDTQPTESVVPQRVVYYLFLTIQLLV